MFDNHVSVPFIDPTGNKEHVLVIASSIPQDTKEKEQKNNIIMWKEGKKKRVESQVETILN